MKFIKVFTLLFLGLLSFQFGSAQTNITDSIKVNGNCGMCKKTIEKSALGAGATTAFWDRKAKVLKVDYDSTKTSNETIQKAVAKSGYDTQNFTAPDEAYEKLEECCHYDRSLLKKKDKK
ncbi:MAG: heavy-metal-associated domain-containing protein [Ginsengibacter sp.]